MPAPSRTSRSETSSCWFSHPASTRSRLEATPPPAAAADAVVKGASTRYGLRVVGAAAGSLIVGIITGIIAGIVVGVVGAVAVLRIQVVRTVVANLWTTIWTNLGRAILSSLVLAVCAAGVALVVWFGDHAKTGQQWWAQGAAGAALVALTAVLILAGGQRYAASETLTLTRPSGSKLTAAEYQSLSEADKANVDVDGASRTVKAGTTVSVTIAKDAQLTREQYQAARVQQLASKVDVTHGSYLHGLYAGVDGRWSTSKIQPLLWTYAVLFGLLSLFIADKFGYAALSRNGGFSKIDFREEYLLLLGGPFAAAVLAKGIVTNKVQNGDLTKTTAATDRPLTSGIQDIISDDSGNTDLVDLQYLLFNLVALTFFFASFIPDLANGFPTMPDFLIGLTSASALTYVTKKAVEKQSPAITNVVPSTVLPLDTITIRGHYLAVDDETPTVKVQGRQASQVAVINAGDPSEVQADVPADVAPADTVAVEVQPTGAAAVAQANVKIIASTITQVTPTPIPRQPNVVVTITGSSFGAAPGKATIGSAELSGLAWSDAAIIGRIDASPLTAGATEQLTVIRADADDRLAGRRATIPVQIA